MYSECKQLYDLWWPGLTTGWISFPGFWCIFMGFIACNLAIFWYIILSSEIKIRKIWENFGIGHKSPIWAIYSVYLKTYIWPLKIFWPYCDISIPFYIKNQFMVPTSSKVDISIKHMDSKLWILTQNGWFWPGNGYFFSHFYPFWWYDYV